MTFPFDSKKVQVIAEACDNHMGCIDTVIGASIQYSYADVTDQGIVIDVVDKKIISASLRSQRSLMRYENVFS